MPVVVIGAAGQLGQDLCAVLGRDAIPLTHQQVELCDIGSIKSGLAARHAQVVINAAAYNQVDDAEQHAELAFQVNALGPRNLAQVCAELDVTLVHYSTDYVFGGIQRRLPISENDLPAPLSLYGLSKLAGEYAIQMTLTRHFIIRTCGLYGLHGSGGKGRNFVETMLRLGRERGVVQVVNDQVCTPTFTLDLAQATAALLQTAAYGLYHWTNRGQCSWHEFASEVFRQEEMAVQCTPISSAQFGARAVRPPYSVLATDKYQSLGMPGIRDWQTALSDYLRQRKDKIR